MRFRSVALSIIVAFCALRCQAGDSGKDRGITVAAAANLTAVAQALAAQFEKQTGIHPVFSFGSTAQLTAQIENGAPFDVFLAADAGHVDKLAGEHLLVPGSDAVYATGLLALWIPPGSTARIHKLTDLAAHDVHTIAAANPKLAPYGAATVETLQRAGIWDRVKEKIVYAENINMARQYGTSKNADAVFTAYSLVLKQPGQTIPVDQSMHQPIVQKLGVMADSRHRDWAAAFANFVLHGGGRAILVRYGYQVH